MARQRKRSQQRPAAPKHGPLNKPTRSHVIMRYEVRRPPQMDGPDWIPRETPPMPDAQAWQLYEAAMAEFAQADQLYPAGAPMRDPYLVRVEVFETPLTARMEETRRATARQEAENLELRAELEKHLAAGGTVEAHAGQVHQ